MGETTRDNLFRSSAFELRDSSGDAGMPVMSVNFARFGELTEIDSILEGHFMERFAPGAFKKTFVERGAQIRAIFQHGKDPVVGLKPLGTVLDLREEQDGAYGDVQLLDTEYVREILPGLRAGLYGASFNFKPIREDVTQRPGKSRDNPDGLPEITVTEARMREFGPVTFGQYENATATVRSLTDEILAGHDPSRLRELADRLEAAAQRADDTTSSEEERAPADEVTPALSLARAEWLRKQRFEDGAPGALPTPR
jgi:hypothetical protein